MSDLNKTLDLSMLGCPLHKNKALAAAELLEAGQSMRIKLNNDAVSNVIKHLDTNGYECTAGNADVLTTIVEVKQK